MYRLLAIALCAIVGMSALAAAFTSRLQNSERAEARAAAAETAGAPRRAAMEVDDAEALTLRRDASGQFHLNVTIRGEEVMFLVDTGADVVALTEETAERLGMAPSAEEFQAMMQTASGTGNGAPITIDSMQVAGSEFRNVDAVVMQGLGTNLLGQSVLRELGKVELQGDTMVIHQR